jgi:hypothetical protein
MTTRNVSILNGADILFLLDSGDLNHEDQAERRPPLTLLWDFPPGISPWGAEASVGPK